MKILLIPLYFHLHEKDKTLFDGMVEAFKQHGQAKIYNGIVQDAISFKPDLIVFQGSVELSDLQDIKHRTGAKITMYTGDCRFAPMQSFVDYKSVVDVYLLPFTGDLLNRFSYLLGKPCEFIWEAIQNWRFKESASINEGKIVFVGNAYETTQADRQDLSSFLTRHVPEFECYGSIINSKGEIDIRDTPNLYNSSFAVICENNYNVEGYFTQRNIGAMASGSCAIMKWFPQIERWFTNWDNCIIYKNKAELVDIINFIKANPDIRNKIARSGNDLAKANFTYNKWADNYLKAI